MNELKLKSCPLCGRDVEIRCEDYDGHIIGRNVVCSKCHLKLEIPSYYLIEDIMEIWNTRAADLRTTKEKKFDAAGTAVAFIHTVRMRYDYGETVSHLAKDYGLTENFIKAVINIHTPKERERI